MAWCHTSAITNQDLPGPRPFTQGPGGLCAAVSPHRFELVSPGVDHHRRGVGGVGGYLLYRWPQFLAVRTMEVTKLPKATTRAPRSNFHATPWNTCWQNRQSTTQSFSGLYGSKTTWREVNAAAAAAAAYRWFFLGGDEEWCDVLPQQLHGFSPHVSDGFAPRLPLDKFRQLDVDRLLGRETQLQLQKGVRDGAVCLK